MAIILSTDDFKSKGKYHIPDVGSAYAVGIPGMVSAVQACIDMFEANYIRRLLGATTGNDFIAWIQNPTPPANADYTKIRDAFTDDVNGWGCQAESLGMKVFLQACIYYEYVHNPLINTMAGVALPSVEAATIISPSGVLRYAENKFNEILKTVEAIQWYCRENKSAFPDFNGQCFEVKYSSLI